MTSWTVILTLALIGLSSENGVTYRTFYFDRANAPNTPHPITTRSGHQVLRSLCFVNNIWQECPLIAEDFRSDHLSDTRNTYSKSNMVINNLYEPNQRNYNGNPRTKPYLHPLSPIFPSSNRILLPQPLFKPLNHLFLQSAPLYSKSHKFINLFPVFRNINSSTGKNLNGRNMVQPDLRLVNVKSPSQYTTPKSHFGVANTKHITPKYLGDVGFATTPVHKQPITEVTNSLNTLSTISHRKSGSSSIVPVPSDRGISNTPVTHQYDVDFKDEHILKSTEKNINNLTNNSPDNNAELVRAAEELILEKQRRKEHLDTFSRALDKMEREFYFATFNKLASISPAERRENGISFAQSGLYLSLLLMALSTETDEETKAEIDQFLQLNMTDTDKIEVIKDILSMLPSSNDDLKFRWATRLVLGASQNVSDQFRCKAVTALQMYLTQVKGTETDEELAADLNKMVEKDFGGAIDDTFDVEEMSGGLRAAVLTTLYLRGRWRSAPTVLNGTRPFHDAEGAPRRSSRMIRINDIMRYGRFDDNHFQALEISYSTPGLSLLMLIPNGASLRPLVQHLPATTLDAVTQHMAEMRVAATLPLYTLRMTLLLPSKLQSMGITKLLSTSNATDNGKLKLSHAVQRLMFWSEAGRNAFKDDGIEWDAPPELELVVDKPYLFFVRWQNITLMSGSFVL